jgi:nucleotide-binding universal stress UspA family protein
MTRLRRQLTSSRAGSTVGGADPPHHVQGSVVVGEAVAEAVIDEAHWWNADLLVMTTHGRSSVRRWLLGSVAEQVVRLTDVPVLLVPSTSAGVWPAARPDGRAPWIVAPLDGTPLGEAALGSATMLARCLHAEVLILRVLRGGGGVRPTDECGTAAALEYLEGVADRLRAQGVTVSISIERGAAAPTILAVGAEQRVDMIAMATHGRSTVGRAILGSAASAVLSGAPVPVLLAPSTLLNRPDALDRQPVTTTLDIATLDIEGRHT